MRYWIHWNDLVQGPFELAELVNLKAFSEDLLVCMEDRDDWVPACRVADLSPAIEQLRSSQIPFLPPSPPPPPKGKPAHPTLQGEFFAEPSGQMHMFEGGELPDGPQAYVRVDETFTPPGAQTVFFTTPIRFVQPLQPLQPRTSTAVMDPPAPVRRPQTVTIPTPVPEPEFKPIPMPIQPPRPATIPTIDQIRPPVITESAVREELPLADPAPEETEPISIPPAIPLGLAPEEASPLPSFAPAAAQATPFNWRLVGWTLAASAGLLLLAYFGYRLFDYSSTRSAIAAVRRETRAAPVVPAVATPVLPRPAPVVEAPVIPAPAPVPTVSRHKKIHLPAPVRRMVQKVVKAKPAPQAAAPKETPAAVVPTMPGLSETPAPLPTPAVPVPPAASQAAVSLKGNDPWIGRHHDAIAIVTETKVAGGKQSIGSRAGIMLQQLHDKELLHAADTGERLYEPDKITWSALREEGSRYRVYLNFSALQVNGERTQTRSYQFLADLATHLTTTDDASARTDFLDAKTVLTHPRDPRAKDIENMLAGVDQLYKQKMRTIIVRNNRKNKTELKQIEAAVQASLLKLQRSIAYIRSQYSEKVLQNVAKAYGFAALVK